jgi:outer membrane protein assembly factor BamE
MTQTRSLLYTATHRAALLMACFVLASCVYRINIQQGNRLDEESIEQVTVGMSQSAVQFLLGTPTVADPFHEGRWDYPYYLKIGRSKEIERRWVIVYFEEGRVSRIERDVTLDPTS